MKKIAFILSIITSAFTFNACSDNDTDNIYGKSSEERRAELIKEYQTALTASENGWILDYIPNETAQNTGHYKIWFKFNPDGTVVTKSNVPIVNDNYSLYPNGSFVPLPGHYKETTTHYKVSSEQTIDLVFEDHMVFHNIYSLSNNTIGGEFEFYFKEIGANDITLISKSDKGDKKTVITLTKATTQDIADLEKSYANFDDMIAKTGKFTYKTPSNSSLYLYDAEGRYILTSTNLETRLVYNTGYPINCLITDVDYPTKSITLDKELDLNLYGYGAIKTKVLYLEPPVSCNYTPVSSNIVGTYNVVSTSNADDTLVDFPSTVTITASGTTGTVFQISDALAGVYKRWYGIKVDIPAKISYIDKCGNFNAAWFNNDVSRSNLIRIQGKDNQDGTFSVFWYDLLGNKVSATYTKQ